MAALLNMCLVLFIILRVENVRSEISKPTDQGRFTRTEGDGARQTNLNSTRADEERASDVRIEMSSIRRKVNQLDEDLRELNETFRVRTKDMQNNFSSFLQLEFAMLNSVNVFVGLLASNLTGVQAELANVSKGFEDLVAKQNLLRREMALVTSEQGKVNLDIGFEISDRCSNGSFDSGGYCYKFTDVPLSWHTARRKCRQADSQLAQFDSIEEQEAVLNWTQGLNLIGPGEWNGFWIGASDIAREGSWVWNSGEYVDKGEYTDWLSGQPDNAHGGEDCMMILVNQSGGAWNDGRCQVKLFALCQKAYREL